MPNCYTLTKIGEAEPTKLVDVDTEMCRFFEVEPHPTKWFHDWHNLIGFSLAVGRTLDELIVRYSTEPGDEDLLPIALWLAENYTVHAWYQVGK